MMRIHSPRHKDMLEEPCMVLLIFVNFHLFENQRDREREFLPAGSLSQMPTGAGAWLEPALAATHLIWISQVGDRNG